jgi:hypothetical protein
MQHLVLLYQVKPQKALCQKRISVRKEYKCKRRNMVVSRETQSKAQLKPYKYKLLALYILFLIYNAISVECAVKNNISKYYD